MEISRVRSGQGVDSEIIFSMQPTLKKQTHLKQTMVMWSMKFSLPWVVTCVSHSMDYWNSTSISHPEVSAVPVHRNMLLRLRTHHAQWFSFATASTQTVFDDLNRRMRREYFWFVQIIHLWFLRKFIHILFFLEIISDGQITG